MARLLADKRDQDFVIWEQMEGEAYLRPGPYGGYDRKMCDMILTEARTLAVKKVLPTLAEGDKEGFMHLLGEMRQTAARAWQIPELTDLAPKLETAANMLGETAMRIGGLAMSPDFKTAFAHSLPFLHAMGDVIMGWMLLWRAEVAAPKIPGVKGKDIPFYKGQVKTAQFFMDTGLPVTRGKMESIQAASPQRWR